MNYFENCYTSDEIKTRYRQWAMKLHPDKGGDAADFRQLQNQYESIQKVIDRQPLLPEMFKINGNYTYLKTKVIYTGRDNHYYKFDKPGGAWILIDRDHLYLIKSDFERI